MRALKGHATQLYRVSGDERVCISNTLNMELQSIGVKEGRRKVNRAEEDNCTKSY